MAALQPHVRWHRGSILGPLLFIIYMDQLCPIPLSCSARFQLYTDDSLFSKLVMDNNNVLDLQTDIDSIHLQLQGLH